MVEHNSVFILFSFIVAFIIAYATTPLVKRLAYKIGAVDIPKDGRRMHKTPKARLGGLAIFYGFLVSVLCFSEFRLPSGTVNWSLIGVLIGIIIIVILGIFDDINALGATFKFAVQVIAAAIPVLLNVRIFAVANPFNPEILITLPAWFSIAISIFWIVGVTNAVNLIDGLDGLAAGISSIAATALLSIFLLQHNATLTILVLTTSLAGACFGFLPYNFNPAKIFMGDTGSTFLGYTLACISIQGPYKTYVAFIIPMLILGLPIFDTLFAIIRRALKGQPIMSPDRGHLHHKLMDRGFSHRTTVIIMYGMSATLAISGVVMLFSNFTRALILIVSVLLVATFCLNFIHINSSEDDEEKHLLEKAQTSNEKTNDEKVGSDEKN